jgi:GAF domain-containing protein
MAERDLDAALQLLADRAQYITGASGAAIALRRGATHDMLCRASAGCNAPELGALLSAEHGLSGESVRTHQALRCDDAENDPRVNRDGCRELGIASAIIMPIIGDEQVIGVFELFSGKTAAFNERDLAALDRLGKMVETAVKHAVAYQTKLEIEEFLQVEVDREDTAAPQEKIAVASALPSRTQTTDLPADSKRPLLWSAAGRDGSANLGVGDARQANVPPVLRQLQKCQACGFPVSPGRAFCVECEDKQWRGERSLPMSEASRMMEERTTDEPPSKSWLGANVLMVGAILVVVLAAAAAAAAWLR